MTEAEWLAGAYYDVISHARGTTSLRKARLAACAFCRRMYAWYTDDRDYQKAKPCLEVAERFADGRVSREELSRARKAVGRRPVFRAALAAASPDAEAVWGASEIAFGLLYHHYGDDRNQADAAAMDLVYEHADIPRDVFGDPFRPVAFAPEWRTDTAVTLVRQMYEAREFSAMPILADALQDAGCDNADVLDHCRDPQATHVRGCWVCDLVLGKE